MRPTSRWGKNRALNPIVQLVVDSDVPEGEIYVGGVQVLSAPTDEELGRGVRTKLVRVANLYFAKRLAHELREDGFEVEDQIKQFPEGA